MKRLIFYTLIFLIAWGADVSAQSFFQTWNNPCKGCIPEGYEIVSGSPAISNPSGYGGDGTQPWLKWNLVSPADPPTYVNGEQQESDPYAVFKSFLTLGHINHPKGSVQDVVRVTIPQFVVGKVYNFHFATMFSKLASSSDAKSITVKISTTGSFPTILKTATFTPLNINNWTNTQLEFTATSDILVFTFSVGANVGTTAYVNLDISRYPFDCVIPTSQVQLFHSNATTRYPCGKIPLDLLEKSTTPPNGTLVWKKGNSYSNEELAEKLIAAAPVGQYFAFYKDLTMPRCLNVQTSTAKAVLSYVETQVQLLKNAISNDCPKTSVSLQSNDIVDADFLENSLEEEVRWFKNNNHQGVPENASAISSSGDYYAFLYHKVNKCYSTDLSTSKVTVTIKACCAAGTEQVKLVRSGVVNGCPAVTANLTTITASNQPPGTSLVWFSDASHTNAVPDPTKVAAGTYYAFFKDNALGCFNTDMSTAKATAYINPCDSKVSLSLKVFLQGATIQNGGVTSMRTNLQSYYGPNSGLLPGTDPYGSGVFNNDINNTQFSGQIVDWVKVEIRSADDPAIVFESQSLWLRPDGTVVTLLGQTPKFNPQPEAVQIVVKHRNHMAIIGNLIFAFTAGNVSYDFTTELSKAYNVVGKPQMILKNGVWCLIAADVNSDFFIDSGDVPPFKNGFKASLSQTYHKTDLNMDGVVDSADVTIFNNNFKAGYYSSTTKYLSN